MSISDMEYLKKQHEARNKVVILDMLVKEMQAGHLCIFAGAGLSAESGYVNWKTLLQPMGDMLGLNMNMDLTLLAQYFANRYTRNELNKTIVEEFNKIPRNNNNMHILASMPIFKYWTTNYDSIIEDELKKTGKKVEVIYNQLQFKYPQYDTDAMVYKMHGDKSVPDEVVLCKEDYKKYDEKRMIFKQNLMVDLISNTFLFIGFSFSDPNLDRILSLVKSYYANEDQKKCHYCFMRNVQLVDYKNIEDERKREEQFWQDYNMQECKIAYMETLGIETILVDSFQQITKMLEYMRDISKLDTIFISGGLAPDKLTDYGQKWNLKETGNFNLAQTFIMDLASELIDKDYKLLTGFGVGVGNYVVLGAYRKRQKMSQKRMEESIYIQPVISAEDAGDEMKEEIRNILLDKCGVAIFLFGKEAANTVQKDLGEDGTYREYKMAKEKGKIIIPIGATGFTSQKIYKEEMASWKGNIYEIYQKLDIQEGGNRELIGNILKVIEYKKQEREEKMKKELVGNERDTKPKVFISFHYISANDEAKKIAGVLRASNQYNLFEEEKHKTKEQIRLWIDNKIELADLIIVFFNQEFLKSRWTEYEVKKSVKREIPFLFIVNEEDRKKLGQYIRKERVKYYHVFQKKAEEDYTEIPYLLDTLLQNRVVKTERCVFRKNRI